MFFDLVVAILLVASMNFHPIESIIKGSSVEENAFRFMVAILGEDNLLCGGVVLTKYFVLTACRCLTFHGQPLESTGAIVYAGHVMIDEIDDIFVHSIEKTTCHKEFNNATHENDIGVIELSSPILFELSGFVFHPIDQACLPLSTVKYQANKCITLGWGMTETGIQSIQLQQANVSIQSDSVCTKYKEEYRSESMICAGGQSDAKGSNYGDSGGPLACPFEEKHKQSWYTIQGIAFMGQDGAANKKEYMPGYYTKVEAYAKWLSKVVNK